MPVTAKELHARDRERRLKVCGHTGGFVAPELPLTWGGLMVEKHFPKHNTVHVYEIAELLDTIYSYTSQETRDEFVCSESKFFSFLVDGEIKY